MHGSAITPGSDESDAENQAQSLHRSQETEVAVERGKRYNCPEAGDQEIIVTKILTPQGAAGAGRLAGEGHSAQGWEVPELSPGLQVIANAKKTFFMQDQLWGEIQKCTKKSQLTIWL